MYSSYASFIKRAEIRIFEQQQPLQAEPLKIIALDGAGLAEWHPTAEILSGPARELKYLLRAYDSKGNFDETVARPLRLYRVPPPGNVAASDGPSAHELLAAYGENDPQPYNSSLDGRLAFYLNGNVHQNWRLTASADTLEGPVKDLFSNFLAKTPDSLFRRIDPNYYYPTFGDDGVVQEMAPTLGKFYVKASNGENYGMWGNFKVGYLDNELAHIDL